MRWLASAQKKIGAPEKEAPERKLLRQQRRKRQQRQQRNSSITDQLPALFVVSAVSAVSVVSAVSAVSQKKIGAPEKEAPKIHLYIMLQCIYLFLAFYLLS